jgi:hypothetical protein
MFNENNIPVTHNDLIKLFFKEKVDRRQKHKVVFLKEKDFSLDFNKMVKFATTTNNQNKFKEFMRMIKKRVINKKLNTNADRERQRELGKTDSSNLIENDFSKSYIRKNNMNSNLQNSPKNFNFNLNRIVEEKKNENGNENDYDYDYDKNNNDNDIENEEIIYLPMSFNNILEHFNNKGKIRENIKKIKNTIVSIII